MAKKKKQDKKLKDVAKIRRQIEQMKERGESEWCEARQSPIHGSGVYARKFIPAETRILEYVGEKINKEESERRAWAQMEHAEETGNAAVYIFTLSKKWDIDGNVPWNLARLVNHSCDPNCQTWIENKRIFYYALRDIEPGEELTFDYGFDIECYEDHPCRCGAENCVGYIVIRDQWPELRKRLKEKAKKAEKEARKKERKAAKEAAKEVGKKAT